MKANEAPEKIYIGLIPSILGGYVYITVNKDFPNAVKYTQTDVFIEKAVEWWMDNFVYTDNVEIKYDTIQRFKNYMKKE